MITEVKNIPKNKKTKTRLVYTGTENRAELLIQDIITFLKNNMEKAELHTEYATGTVRAMIKYSVRQALLRLHADWSEYRADELRKAISLEEYVSKSGTKRLYLRFDKRTWDYLTKYHDLHEACESEKDLTPEQEKLYNLIYGHDDSSKDWIYRWATGWDRYHYRFTHRGHGKCTTAWAPPSADVGGININKDYILGYIAAYAYVHNLSDPVKYAQTRYRQLAHEYKAKQAMYAAKRQMAKGASA